MKNYHQSLATIKQLIKSIRYSLIILIIFMIICLILSLIFVNIFIQFVHVSYDDDQQQQVQPNLQDLTSKQDVMLILSIIGINYLVGLIGCYYRKQFVLLVFSMINLLSTIVCLIKHNDNNDSFKEFDSQNQFIIDNYGHNWPVLIIFILTTILSMIMIILIDYERKLLSIQQHRNHQSTITKTIVINNINNNDNDSNLNYYQIIQNNDDNDNDNDSDNDNNDDDENIVSTNNHSYSMIVDLIESNDGDDNYDWINHDESNDSLIRSIV